jgi:hypothetical protein
VLVKPYASQKALIAAHIPLTYISEVLDSFGVDHGVGPPQVLVPQQEGGTLELTHSCFVLDDGGEWTLNRASPESNGWNASSRFPTPGR